MAKNIGKYGALLATIMAVAPFCAAQAQDAIKIGFVGGFTGYLAPYDQPTLQGIELAVEQINKAGGIDGKQIELISRDMRSDTAQAAVTAQEVVDQGVQVMIAPCDVDPAVATGQITQAAQIPTIAACASTPILPGMVGDYMFANYTADNLQATALADYALEQGYKNALVLLSRDTPYTEMLPRYFATVFEKKGGTVAATLEFKMGQQDFSAEVTKIKELSPAPDVVMTAAYEPDFPAFIRQLRSAGITAPVLGSDGIDSPTTLELGEVAEGVVFSNAGYPTPGSALEKFNADFKAHFGEEPSAIFTATGYDVIKVVEAAVKATGGNLEGPALRDAIDNLENVAVATGSITYKGMNRVPLRVVALNKVQGGQKVHVANVTPNGADVPPAQ
ncbi:amino acid/amide ABC transporter substrate-binding protein (HAAT family) [Dongia mobilis]|uniref:Amino acid/amide ABC transporter substrate-binding protein (HAAT family) n=1 Tax=Dongia mobilis TaxID=578943 RepID=A0A4R6WWS9_9PROT|nr:ABC transporter substrate-binding protein [Dongia mobilis]TDQ83843.1 amino acid/amide ABC transporter substrate-binding protein (HAAT family) [Dongia mobilis]